MGIVRSFVQQVAAVLFGVLLSLVVPGTGVHAQTIANIAEASWVVGGTTQRIRSNLVETPRVPDGPEIRTFVPGEGGTLSYLSPSCGARQGIAPPSSHLQEVAAIPSRVVRAGRDLYFTVDLASANLNPGAIDSVDVVLTASTGDREALTIYETGANTGSFTGRIATHRLGTAFAAGDCRLDLENGNEILVDIRGHDGTTSVISTMVEVLADPFGIVFDSETGDPVSGATVSLVHAATGAPADVFAEDGVTRWPSTVVSGQTVTDAAGRVTQLAPGEFWFPLTRLGDYRLVVAPPSPYTNPSAATPAQLARLSGPGGRALVIVDGSFGGSFALADPTPVLIDIPLDRPASPVQISKTASRQSAQPGEAIFYTLNVRNPESRVRRDVVVTDSASPWLRLRRDSVRIDGTARPEAVTVSADGRLLTIALGDLPGGAQRRITYAMSVAPDAPPGHAENRADVRDSLGRVGSTSTSVRIERDGIAGRLTIIGRITAGDCTLEEGRIGIPGVRVMLEDGSFAITDADGRYHFEGVVPGTHVVQAARSTLPEGGRLVDCTRSTRSAGSAASRFVTGRGGQLVVVDFHARVPAAALLNLRQQAAAAEASLLAAQSAPAEPEADWLALGDGPDDWLAPAPDANPRTTAVRVAIRHRRGHTVTLSADGEAVNALAFEGTSNGARGNYAVSQWRGVPLRGATTRLVAEIRDRDGNLVTTLERDVHFTSIPARIELVEDRSRLIADGRTAPVIALRVLDAAGRPMREGVSGEFTLSAPYESAAQVAQQQLNQLTRQGLSSARWTVEGSEGLALVELAPTMVSGQVQLDFRFDDGEIVREQQLDAWIMPGDIEWTIIGLAEGTIGAQSVADNMEREGSFDSDLGDDGRVALYAKGRVLGRFLVTLAYDSAKQEDDQRLLGTLDPDAYYTVFADASSRRFDAASREKLYVRIEAASFYALYGDFETGFDRTQLTRYQRTATGVRAQAQIGQVLVSGFGADIGTRFRRDEMQGEGISGPYRLSSRALVPNSEKVALEVRDRFRSEVIVERRELTRFADYDIDPLAGTITFRQPVLSRDFQLNPQFIVVDYETESSGAGELNAGLRAEWESDDGGLRIGASAITDRGDGDRTEMGGVDLRARIGSATEVRAELAASRRAGETATGWLVEAQHQTGSVDVIAYARSLDETYGVDQQNGVELGRRKLGVDGRVRLTEDFSVLASLWQDDSVTDPARRRAAQVELTHSGRTTDMRVGLAHFADRLADGERRASTVLEAGVTQRLLNNRLEVSASTSIALDDAESVDLPARHRIGARYAITDNVRLVGVYEIARGDAIDAESLRAGFEITPWIGGLVRSDIGRQDIGELGSRDFAAFGLAQTLQVSPELSLDATIDSNWTINSTPAASDLVNPLHPAASGGQLSGGELFEEFTAITAGASWRKDRWSATARGEWRDGEYANRHGLTAGVVRQIGEGSMFGSGFTWTHATGSNGATSEIADAVLAMAHRPAESEFAFLGKLEYRSDEVTGAVAGETGPAGRTALLVDGDAVSRRMLASLSTNWSPRSRDEDAIGSDDDPGFARRSEFGLFLGLRHNFDSYDGYDLAGTTLLGGLDARIGIGERIELGATATVRSNVTEDVTAYAFGPQMGVVPVENVLVTIGYNFAGFDDPDYSTTRHTTKGIYAAVRMKFDADSLGFLGLDR